MRYFIFCFFRNLGRCFGAFTVLAAVMGALLATACTYAEGGEEGGHVRVTFLDVGQGLAVLLEAGGRYALYDTGPDSIGFVDTLLARGIDTLEWVLVSHNHRDHAGGFMEIGGGGMPASRVSAESRVKNVPKSGNGVVLRQGSGNTPRVHVRQLFVGPDTSGGFIRDSVLRIARRFGIPVDTLVRGTVLELGGFAGNEPRVEVLWPPEQLRVGENGASVVLQVAFGAASVLLPGDLDTAGERRLLELSPMLATNLVQVGHHGSSGSSSLDFISKLAPEYAVVSAGAGNPYGHPSNSVVRKLEYVLGDSSRIFRTDRDGSVEFELYFDLGVIP